jgi:cellulose synthase/poly-beta-1,6-N-acetylglucosamine synthase-like glycosyltransferase
MTEGLLLFIITLYFLQLGKYWTGWKKSKINKNNEIKLSHNRIFVSIVIALKNEEENIQELIYSISQQEFPSESFEVILVDDHSTDNTRHKIEQIRKKQKITIHSFKNDINKHGKKAALTLGINEARGKLIVQTDADCRMNKDWLASIVKYYKKFQPGMILGPVEITGNSSFLSWFQMLEHFALMINTGGSAYFNRPILANGANMAYEKKLFYEFKDPFNSKFSSGDDIFFTLNVSKKHSSNISFIKSRESIVRTSLPKKFNTFWKQRKRWIQKSSGYRNFNILFSSVIILLGNLATLGSLVFSILTNEWWLYFAVFGIKSLIDIIQIITAGSFFKIKIPILYLVLAQVIYPIYTIILAISGIVGETEWKERKIK